MFIHRKDMWAIVAQTDRNKNPIPFEIEFVTADQNRQTGGEIKHIAQAILYKKHKSRAAGFSKPAANTNNTIAGVPTSNNTLPNHYQNQTLNLYDLDQQKIIKIHTQLILSINKHEILP